MSKLTWQEIIWVSRNQIIPLDKVVRMLAEKIPNKLISKRVLLVEDDDDLRETLREMLTADGAKVEVARNVDDATRVLKTHEFDIILSDLQMPLKSGMALLQWCHETGVQTRGQSTPFVFYTGHREDIDEKKARDLGARAILQKPLRYSELVSKIAEITNKSELFYG